MKNARQLLEEFIATPFRDPKQAASMFTADGTFGSSLFSVGNLVG
jgi:hypothetical protein